MTEWGKTGYLKEEEGWNINHSEYYSDLIFFGKCPEKRALSQFSQSVWTLWTLSGSLQCHGLQHASLPVHHQLSELLKLISIKSVIPPNHLYLCRPLLLLPPIPPSIRVFSNESTLHMRWPKYWSFRFSISPSNEYSGLISFRMDWLDLIAVQATLKSSLIPQFKSINSLALSFLYSPTLRSIHD